jgi:hypothetical protein
MEHFFIIVETPIETPTVQTEQPVTLSRSAQQRTFHSSYPSWEGESKSTMEEVKNCVHTALVLIQSKHAGRQGSTGVIMSVA